MVIGIDFSIERWVLLMKPIPLPDKGTASDSQDSFLFDIWKRVKQSSLNNCLSLIIIILYIGVYIAKITKKQ